jgi:ABC-type phosphate/phosphonate transport system substrate-binding protein
VASGAVLSGLRRAAAGDKVALVLDSAEAGALPTLPFAKELEVVTRSAPLPATLVCSLDGRVGSARVEQLKKALLDLALKPSGPAVLAAMRTERFIPLDSESLRRARAAYLSAKDSP